MNRHDSIFAIGLAAFSTLVSFVFVYYAMGILTAPHPPEAERVFAYVAAGYGLGNIYILSAAWRDGSSWPVTANKLLAFCFFGVFLFEGWRTGVQSSLEVVKALGVAGVLALNWFAVRTVSRRTR